MKLDRCSFSTREQWVDKNIKNIMDFDTNDKLEFLKKADSPFLFAALCLEFRRFMKFMGNTSQECFSTNLPIQFDATCNGYQHLAMLSYQYDIFKSLNLAPASEFYRPGDFYVTIVSAIESYFNDILIGGTVKEMCLINQES